MTFRISHPTLRRILQFRELPEDITETCVKVHIQQLLPIKVNSVKMADSLAVSILAGWPHAEAASAQQFSAKRKTIKST
jgi:hypothetical protein